MSRWGLGIPPDSRGAQGGGDPGVIGVHWNKKEHGGEVHLHPEHYGHLTGSGEATRVQGSRNHGGSRTACG